MLYAGARRHHLEIPLSYRLLRIVLNRSPLRRAVRYISYTPDSIMLIPVSGWLADRRALVAVSLFT